MLYRARLITDATTAISRLAQRHPPARLGRETQPGRMAVSGVRRVCGGLLHPILRLSLVDCLPLHISRAIRPAALQGDHMINDVAGTWACRQMRGWAGMLALEGCSGGLATLYAPVGVTLDSWC